MAQQIQQTNTLDNKELDANSLYYRSYRAAHPDKDRKYRETHREQINARRRAAYRANREEIIQRQSEYQKQHYEEKIAYNKDWAFRKRLELMNIIGCTKCKTCGFCDPRALQFDHINGGGRLDLKRFSHTSQMVAYYIKNPELAKTTLQVLCANCNWIKVHVNRENTKAKYVAQRKVDLHDTLSEKA